MEININVFLQPDRKIVHLLKRIIMNQQELREALEATTAQNEKARVEILQKISDLEAAVANAGNTSPEVDAALAALRASVQTDDDIVPDVPVTPAP